MKKIIGEFRSSLEKVDQYRDEFLFLFIKPFWPRKITPNHVTSVRIAIGVLLFILLFFFKFDNKTFIISLFCVGVLTDFLDGPIARGLNKVTEFGAMLDSTADRILIVPIAIYSLFSPHKWLLLTLLLMEVVNTLVAIFYKSKEVYLESNVYGKTKMVLQSLVFITILVVWPDSPPQTIVNLLWLSLPFSLFSMFSKIMELKNKRKLRLPQINL